MMDSTSVLIGVGVGIGVAGFILALKAMEDKNNTQQSNATLTDIVRDDDGRIIEMMEKPVSQNYVLQPEIEVEAEP